MNILAYFIYLFITYIITVRVGWLFYRNGRIFILTLLRQNVPLTDAINKLLLTGYYLLNLGYTTLMISTWHTIITWTALLESIITMTGTILLTLALMHFFNMLVIYLISKKTTTFHHLKQ
ncbi:hypothetical protein [Chitinophaga nivalis]|uniref:Uncharacterized protein n=1 Tax=Chitinophaga nivalis TaxID=2991709 RepID=A0ABT3IP06_9BACT|nr:hypothetical protein [Chitinophaga nivalis]MCW3464604.1 hypothetical protein [Chitinophaga nivalis]MCW3485705.1 hypothetical protein [Chitinophaga nivalis]